MITLNQYLELIQYKVTEGYKFSMYSDDAYCLYHHNENKKFSSVSIVFDMYTRVVYAAEIIDTETDSAYVICHPSVLEQTKQGFDNFSRYKFLETVDEFIELADKVLGLETIQFDMDDETMALIEAGAKAYGLPFDAFVSMVLHNKLKESLKNCVDCNDQIPIEKTSNLCDTCYENNLSDN
jgi:hypothetical protein